MSHAGEPSARPKNPVPHIDILIRSGRFTALDYVRALVLCVGDAGQPAGRPQQLDRPAQKVTAALGPLLTRELGERPQEVVRGGTALGAWRVQHRRPL